MLRRRLNERQAQVADLPAEQLHGLLDRDRVDLAEQRVDQVMELELQLRSLGIAVLKAELAHSGTI